jgi:hypothetical protein
MSGFRTVDRIHGPGQPSEKKKEKKRKKKQKEKKTKLIPRF